MATNTFDPHGDDDLAPQETGSASTDAGLASNLIREKLNQIYAEEPDATHELTEAAAKKSGQSKHQKFMYELGNSGKDLAAIQTEWHKYYESLPDEEKHAVWHEFYASQSTLTRHAADPKQGAGQVAVKHKGRSTRGQAAARVGPAGITGPRSAKDIQKTIRETVRGNGRLEPRHNLQSLLFGLGLGLIVVIIFLFGFFNEVVIAPFIQPSRATAATPIIVSSDSIAPTSKPEVIIPKINVEIPADYSQISTSESAIENALQGGVVHYPTTALPGQKGNAAFFGHSSNNIFNKGKYKFAFVLLHTLQPGDTFYLTYQGKVYVYKVITRKIVNPNNVGVLGPVPGQTATATLITCDPPGTSLHRLIVIGQQVSPDPAGNAQAATSQETAATPDPTQLPGNGPTLWGRFIGTTAGKVILGAGLLGGGLLVIRRLNKWIIG